MDEIESKYENEGLDNEKFIFRLYRDKARALAIVNKWNES